MLHTSLQYNTFNVTEGTYHKAVVAYEVQSVFDLIDCGFWLISVTVGIAWLFEYSKVALLKNIHE